MELIGLMGLAPTELIVLAIAAVALIAFWRIFAKAGFPGGLALLILIPVVNLLTLLFLAFAEWPALKRNRNTLLPESTEPKAD